MTLYDHENSDIIVNPYITLFDTDRDLWVALNTNTFANAQDQLILRDEYERLEKISKRGDRLFPAIATIGRYNTPTPSFRSVQTDGANDAIALVPLGFLLEDTVKRLFPKAQKFLTKNQG